MPLKIIVMVFIAATFIGLSWANYSLSKKLGAADAACVSKIAEYKAEQLALISDLRQQARESRVSLEQSFNEELRTVTDLYMAQERSLFEQSERELDELELQPEEEEWAEQLIPLRLLP